MNVEIGTEAAQFPEKEYRNGIFVAVQAQRGRVSFCKKFVKCVVLLSHLNLISVLKPNLKILSCLCESTT
jgi:hypothetical protein